MKRAFTLIELLVVIAIIAILAAILFPVFAQAKAAAKGAATLSNAKQEALAHTMYNNDNDDMSFIPWIRCCTADGPVFPQQILYPYTKNLALGWDASSPMPNITNITNPSGPGAWGQFGTISWNEWAMWSSWSGNARNMGAQENAAQRCLLTAFSNPQGLFNDSSDPQSGDIGWYTFDALEQSCYDTADTGYVNNPNGGVTRAADLWHQGNYIAAFLDGHAKSAKSKVFRTTGCWGKTGSFWGANFAGKSSPPADSALVADTDWAAFFIAPENLNFWGRWWSDN